MFAQYMGKNQIQHAKDPLVSRGIELWYERVRLYYLDHGGVDVEVIKDQLLLNDETVAHIYSEAFTELQTHYQVGSRPALEQVIKDIITDNMDPMEQVITIMQRVRDNQDYGLAQHDLFYGGSEEDLLKRGAIMCNEVSRLFACLCQIVGLPARLFCSHIAGHMMNEVYVDGKWIFVDAMKGLLPVNAAGEGLSAWELHQDPTLLVKQPQSVIDRLRTPGKSFAATSVRDKAFILCRTRDCYFYEREAIAVGNYYIQDHMKYTYAWTPNRPLSEEQEEMLRLEYQNRKALGFVDYYFNERLFDETVDACDAAK